MFGKMFSVVSVLVFLVSFIPAGVLGIDFPKREIEFIAAYAPGSNTDNFARLAAKFGEKYVGKPIVVVNKPGGGGSKGFAVLASAKPDGYTVGLVSNAMISHPYLFKGISYNYKKSFRVISQIDYSAQGLYAKKGSAFDISLKELVKKAKETPETIKVAIGGIWTTEDFTRALFEDEAGVKFRRISYPTAGDMIPALLGGHVDYIVGPPSVWAHLYKAGEVSVLAMSTEQRDPQFPNIPTFKELGYDVVLYTYHWVAAPAGTPDSIVNFLAEAFKRGFSEQTFKEAAANLGAVGAWENPEGSMKSMERVDQLYQRVVKRLDLKPE